MESMDLIVIGAGWNGLAVAKTFREMHPSRKLLVLDCADTIGGVWAQHRLYPGLRSNNMLGTYEFSDFPMDEATFGVKPGQFIPGPVIHDYLRRYAHRFDVYKQIRFGVRVQTVERMEGGGWILTTTTAADLATPRQQKLQTRKLVIATGLTSTPNVLSIPGSPSFAAPIFHILDFLQNASTLKTATAVTVMGGTKSAWDVAYEYAAHGIRVDMVIRPSGHGPTWMAPPYVTPLKRWLEKLAHIRLLTWFSPCVWGEADGLGGVVRRLLHGTTPGRWVVGTYWWIMGNDILTLNGYEKHSETAKLKPWTDPFLTGATGLSILNYPTDFFELVRNGTIKVHIADITHLSTHTVHLNTGVELRSDTLVCASGWKFKPAVEFLPGSLESCLGLPSAVDDDLALTRNADAKILETFPSLRNRPAPSPPSNPNWKGFAEVDTKNEQSTLMTPYRLYRFMVPPALIEDRSVAFAGAMMTISTPLIAQTQALWITAYFSAPSSNDANGKEAFVIPSVDQAKHETVLHTEFCKLRSPQGFGARFPDFVFDAVPYLDLLLRDLGLSGRRKESWRDWWEAYGPGDYTGLVGEWLAKKTG